VAQAMATHPLVGQQDAYDAEPVRTMRHGRVQDTDILTVIWTTQGKLLYLSDARVNLPFSPAAGPTQIKVGKEAWIVHTAVTHEVVVQAAQQVSQRRHMAAESALTVVLPMLALMAVVAGLLVYGLRRGLQPLGLAANDVATRSALSLEPVSLDKVPREIAPLVQSINELMSRLSVSFAAQQQFLADAAHELRTPVSALRLQLQLLQMSTDAAERNEALLALQRGVARAQRLIEQLMLVARTSPESEPIRMTGFDLSELARDVVASFSTQAERSGIDLGARAGAPTEIQGDRDQITSLLGNLVENALRYTPAGGVVDVEVRKEGPSVLLCVIDNGPGIAADERERVFDRFYRGNSAIRSADGATGSGLGLAIVRAIAARHGAQVSLLTSASGQGLEVRVHFVPNDH
jgi:two-component system, OmpR family, sensor kinase